MSPARARRLSAAAIAVPLLLLGASPGRAGDPGIEERVEVSRVLLDVRAVDGRGRAIPDLGPGDFLVEVDGREVRVESADWISGTLPDIEGLPIDREASADWQPSEGRLIVLLFQRGLLSSRMTGLMRMREIISGFLEDLPPEDRVAIFVHDVRLKVYSDFTDDRERLAEILSTAVVEQRPAGEVQPEPFPSILEEVDPEEAAGAANVEDGLLILGRALWRLPGAKTLIFIGWGLNRWEGASHTLGEALGYLVAGRVTMFSMDVTDADTHTLEGPMIQAAEESGGFYVKTHIFSEGAMSKVSRAMTGVYEVSFIKPRLPEGRHNIVVKLRGRKGETFHRRFYDD